MDRRAFVTLPVAVAAISTPSFAASVFKPEGSDLPAGVPFINIVSPESHLDASWELYFTPNGKSVDGILIRHTLNAPSSGIHVLSTALSSTPAGHAGGFAMSGPGTANALTGNRYEDGDGNGATGNRVGTGSGYGGQFAFSSEGNGGALYAIKQNSGYTGKSGTGAAFLAENISDSGEVILSASAQNNDSPLSNVYYRHNSRHGIVTDVRVVTNEERTGAVVGSRVALTPGENWGGAPSVTGIQTILSSTVSGSEMVSAADLTSHASGNKQNVGVIGEARGENDTNYGGRFSAGDGAVNVALRADGDFWLIDGTLYAPNLPVHNDNSHAIGDGLGVGRVYRTPDGSIRVVVAS